MELSACLGAGSGLRNCDRLGNDEERQANLEPILEKASNSQTRKRRRELDRRSSVPRGLEPALPEYEWKTALQLPSPPPPRLRKSLANVQKPPRKLLSPLPTPIFLQRTLFLRLKLYNAFITSSGVSRTPSSGTLQAVKGRHASPAFLTAPPLEFRNKSWLYAHVLRWRRLCSGRSRRSVQECQ